MAIGQSLSGVNDLTTATAGLLSQVRAPLRSDIAQLMGLAATLDDSKEVVGGVIQRLPTKLDRIVSTATDGGWFNFYLCGADLDLSTVPAGPLADALAPPNGVKLVNPAPRCATEVPQ